MFLRRGGHRELQGEVVDQGANQTAGGHRGTVRTTNYYHYIFFLVVNNDNIVTNDNIIYRDLSFFSQET